MIKNVFAYDARHVVTIIQRRDKSSASVNTDERNNDVSTKATRHRSHLASAATHADLYGCLALHHLSTGKSAYVGNLLLLAAIPPALSTAIELLRRRRLNLLGALVLAGIAIRILSALLLKDVRLILISDSLMIGVYGIIALASLLFGRPLLLTLAMNMLADTPAAEREQFEKRWRDAGSSYFTFITALWGIGLTLVLVLSVILTYSLTVQQFVLVGPIIQYSMFGVLILVSQGFGILRRYQRHRQLERSQRQT